MPKSVKAIVSPRILEWARNSSGYSAEEVAARLSKTKDFIEALEQGADDVVLTMGQLRSIADLYKRPISDFFLPKRPNERPLPHDFRSPVDGARRFSPELIKELRRAQNRRDQMLSIAQDLGEDITSIGYRASVDDDSESVAREVRSILNIEYETQRQWGDGPSAYKAWRHKLGSAGCLVFQFDTISIDDLLGFSLTDRPLPVIAVNVKMKPNGRTFTMLHEFAHVLLQKSSVCDLDDVTPRKESDVKVEVFCNAVAAATLLPRAEFLANEVVASRQGASEQWTDTEISVGAKDFGASREAFVRRLLTLGRTTQGFYNRKRTQYIRERAAQREREKEKNKDKELKRNWAERAITNLDRPFIQAVLRGYHDQRMTLLDAAQLIDVRPEKVREVEARLTGAQL